MAKECLEAVVGAINQGAHVEVTTPRLDFPAGCSRLEHVLLQRDDRWRAAAPRHWVPHAPVNLGTQDVTSLIATHFVDGSMPLWFIVAAFSGVGGKDLSRGHLGGGGME